MKHKIKYIISPLLIIITLCLTFNIVQPYGEVKNEYNYENIEKLAEKSKEYPNINKISNNINLYPESLIDLASKNDEAIDFVANYPEYKEKIRIKDISIKEDYKKGNIPLFIQWDKRWGYDKYGSEFIAINGCGPTSLAMVAVGLTGDTSINPKVVADYSRKNGYLANNVGTSWNLMTEGAKHFGLYGMEISLDENVIISKLRQGHPIIASMGPGEFTSEGHFIVLAGIDENGKIIVNDSNSKINSSKKWDIDVFMKETKNLWSFEAI